MKHVYSILLACTLVLCMGCGEKQTVPTTEEATTQVTTEEATTVEVTTEEATTEEVTTEEETTVALADPFQIVMVGDIMPYEFFETAQIGATVIVEGYISAKEAWHDNQATFYLHNESGAFVVKNLGCNWEEFGMMNTNVKLRVSGVKTEENVIEDAKFYIVSTEDRFSSRVDITEMIDSDKLEESKYHVVFVKQAKVVASVDASGNEVGCLFGADGSGKAGDAVDLYFTIAVGDKTMTMSIPYTMCNTEGQSGMDNDIYTMGMNLSVGASLDIHAIMGWTEEGPMPYVTGIMMVG